MTSTKKRTQNATNARLFQNMGPGKGLGHFRDVTNTAKIMPDLSSPFFRNRDESLHRHCRQINAGELREVLHAIKEPVKSPAGGKELREAFDTFIRTIEHGKIGRRQMNVTLNDDDPKQYS